MLKEIITAWTLLYPHPIADLPATFNAHINEAINAYNEAYHTVDYPGRTSIVRLPTTVNVVPTPRPCYPAYECPIAQID